MVGHCLFESVGIVTVLLKVRSHGLIKEECVDLEVHIVILGKGQDRVGGFELPRFFVLVDGRRLSVMGARRKKAV